MWFKTTFLLLASCIPSSLAIFADEVNHLDFHHALLGVPSSQSTFFHRPTSSSNASLLYTLSEKQVIGAVNPKDGSIVWRQNLARWTADDQVFDGLLRASDGESSVVSSIGHFVTAWSALDGKLVWQSRFVDGTAKDLELLELEDGQTGSARDVISLFGDKTGIVRRLDGVSGNVKWEFKDERFGFFLFLSASFNLRR
jgi:outer membrane protein assembly factor BamB